MISELCYVLVLICCCQIHAEESESTIFELKNNSTKKSIYTAKDLIQFLSRLAQQEITPRLRFPSNDYDDNSDYLSNDNVYQNDPYFVNDQNFNQNSNQNDPNYINDQNFNQNLNQNVNQYYNPGLNNQGSYLGLNRPQYTQDGQYYQQGHENINQGPFYRPPRKRRPKKRPNKYRRPIPISQDPLDPYLQNYPPNQGDYPQNIPGGYPQNYPPYPQNYPPYPQNYPPYPQNYPPYPQDQYYQGNYPQGPGINPFSNQGPFGNLMNALNSIAKHDDQQCVPRLLCEVAAGGNPSYRQNSYLPSFISTESLFTLLSALTGSVSPLLVFGRAALLGVTSQGRPSSCRYAYPECPRDPDRLVEYLNNHNGGFFRFFNGINNLQDQPSGSDGVNDNNNQQGSSSATQQQQGLPFGLSQLTQLFGQSLGQISPGQFGQNTERPYASDQNGLYNQRPGNYPYRGDLSNQRYPFRFESQYRGGLNNSEITKINGEARILTKPFTSLYHDYNRDSDRIRGVNSPFSNDLYISQSYHDVKVTDPSINNGQQDGSWKFPESDRYSNQLVINAIPDDVYIKTNLKFPSSSTSDENVNRRPKALFFPTSEQSEDLNLYFPKPLPFYDHTKMIFPDRTGTGNLKFDSDKLAPVYRPDIYRKQVPPYNQRENYYPNQYQSSSQKKYVYVVRGNGDPNHPEIVEEQIGRHLAAASDESSTSVNVNRRAGSPWTFPSPYQGFLYSDRSFEV